MLSKLITKTLKPTLTRVLVQNKQLTRTVYKAMATTEVAKVDKGKQKLSKAIAREIKFEEENYQADDTAKVF